MFKAQIESTNHEPERIIKVGLLGNDKKFRTFFNAFEDYCRSHSTIWIIRRDVIQTDSDDKINRADHAVMPLSTRFHVCVEGEEEDDENEGDDDDGGGLDDPSVVAKPLMQSGFGVCSRFAPNTTHQVRETEPGHKTKQQQSRPPCIRFFEEEHKSINNKFK